MEAEAARLMSELPSPHAQAIADGPEKAGAEAHAAAVQTFMKTHNCRTPEVPAHVEAAYQVYGYSLLPTCTQQVWRLWLWMFHEHDGVLGIPA